MSGAVLPSVSVIVPCYQAEETIATAVRSVLGDAAVTEVIVVDDGSRDGSVAVARAIGDRVTVLTGPNRGACHARNRGLAAASADHVLFLDADDRIEPGFIDALAAATAVADVVIGGHRHLAADGSEIGVTRYDPARDRLGLLADYLRLSVQTGAILWRRSWLVADGRWDETLPVYQDIDYFIRMMLRGPRIAVVSEGPLVIWQDHASPTRISNTLGAAKAEAILRVLEDAARAIPDRERDDLQQGLAWRAYGLARRAYASGLDPVGHRALRLARALGLRGHRGSLGHRVARRLLGLRGETRLVAAVKRLRA